MNGRDIFLTLIIIIVFVLLYLFIAISVGKKNVENNWPIYRCNPAIMPFASLFGHDVGENFTHCIQSMQTKYSDYLNLPLHYGIHSMGSIGGELVNSIQSVRAFISKFRGFITFITGDVFGVFLSVLIEFQRGLIVIKDIMGKLLGVLTSLIYTLDGSVKTMGSLWNGPPGSTVRALSSICFHPDTKVKLIDDTILNMKDVPLNAILKNGETVRAVMTISNQTKNGDIKEKLYMLPNGEGEDNDDHILVTGSHLVYLPNQDKFVPIYSIDEATISSIDTPILSCLITSDHTIPLGRWIFHDWEDNNTC
jgi:hypothetical protein